MFMTFSQIHHKWAHYIVIFFSHSSQINSPFGVFYKIHLVCRPNSPVSIDTRIIFHLRGMNISYWSHMSGLHWKKNYYQNIILCQHGPTYCILLTWHEYIMLVPHVRFASKNIFFLTIPLGYCFICIFVCVIISLYYALCTDPVQLAWESDPPVRSSQHSS
jgi:hypothetical protein